MVWTYTISYYLFMTSNFLSSFSNKSDSLSRDNFQLACSRALREFKAHSSKVFIWKRFSILFFSENSYLFLEICIAAKQTFELKFFILAEPIPSATFSCISKICFKTSRFTVSDNLCSLSLWTGEGVDINFSNRESKNDITYNLIY